MNVKKVLVPFNTPVRMPNGLQWFDNELFVIDQLTDDVFVLDQNGTVKRVIRTETENGSGITVGGGFIWTACNGTATAHPPRPYDDHISKVRKLDPYTGETVSYFPTPDGGGIHGIEWYNGNIWLTAFKPKSLILVDGINYTVLQQFPCKLNIPHGLAVEGNGIWCADRAEKLIVKFDMNTGKEIDQIRVAQDGPDLHGLTILGKELWYSDADWPAVEVMRGYPEIGIIKR